MLAELLPDLTPKRHKKLLDMSDGNLERAVQYFFDGALDNNDSDQDFKEDLIVNHRRPVMLKPPATPVKKIRRKKEPVKSVLLAPADAKQECRDRFDALFPKVESAESHNDYSTVDSLMNPSDLDKSVLGLEKETDPIDNVHEAYIAKCIQAENDLVKEINALKQRHAEHVYIY